MRKNVPHYLSRIVDFIRAIIGPNRRGITCYEPGHYYSPLLDIRSFVNLDIERFAKGELDLWEHFDLNEENQKRYFQSLSQLALPHFPSEANATFRYCSQNTFFPLADAALLSAVLIKERPKQIIEVGSGWSSAAILDTLQFSGLKNRVCFIEPNPERLHTLLREHDRINVETIAAPVQEVALSYFDQLSANDILFIDSSHVAKIGSDVTFLILSVLPRLKPGVLIHFHDIFYPLTYSMEWIRRGIAWNEAIVLRAFLLGNKGFEVVAFNSYAAERFPEIMASGLRCGGSGGSLWLRKVL